METVAKRLYEGMFLVDSAQAAADWDGTLSVISNILQRAEAEVVSMRKWQERKLAYEIDHKTRGTYILCYFKAEGARIAGIEKDVLLSEKVMRVLVLGTEKRPPEMIERDATLAESEDKPASASAPTAEGATPPEPAAAPPATPPEPAAAPPAAPPQEAVSDGAPATPSDEAAGQPDEGAPEAEAEADSEAPPKTAE